MTLREDNLIYPDWPAPARVRAIQTTRAGGVSRPPYDSLNLGLHVADQEWCVARNRQQLNRFVPTEPVWLQQTHGTQVVNISAVSCVPHADAAYTRSRANVCVIMTADCLPVLLCNQQGTVVAAIHAGWRGLCAGVLEAAVDALQVAPETLMAWLGPAIGPRAFEVGSEVRTAFIAAHAQAEQAFLPHNDRWLCNIYQLAQQRLMRLGIDDIHGGGVDQQFCTCTESARFFSYRRDGRTGRMATMIWLE